MADGYWILLSLFLICTTIRSIYEWLKKQGRISPTNRLIFALIASDMAILWLSWFSLCPIDPFHLQLTEAVKWIGLGITVIGSCLAVGALLQLKGVENIENLRTRGLFTVMRHPMYTGFMLWFLGWAVYNDAGISLIAGLYGIGHVLYWRRVEEEALVNQFGDAYRRYREKTWF
jgi:protein-S-isoprenylcysteine O-methyltransferase Ste14